MPLEIRELVIRAVVEAPRAASPPTGLETSGPRQQQDDKRAIVSACVREVLRVLDRARER